MENSHRVKQYRLARAWSQEQLAELASMSVRTVQRIENGEKPSLETLSALAAVFEVSVADLAGNEVLAEEVLDQRVFDARAQVKAETSFWIWLCIATVICTFYFIMNHLYAPRSNWAWWATGIWAGVLTIIGLRTFVFRKQLSHWQQKRLQSLLRKQP